MKAQKSKYTKYPLVILFLLVLILPSTLFFTDINGFERTDENRTFNDSLSININNLDDFPADYESFANDNFFFRTPMLNFFHRMKFKAFNISPHPEKAIVGKDGWFFKSGRELEIINEELNFSTETLDSFTNEWKARTQYFEQLNIPVFWLIAPMKHRIYSEKLPFNYSVSENNRIEHLKAHLKSDFPNLIIDPSALLKSKKEELKLYFKLDNHWNQRSGYLVSQLIINQLKSEFPSKNVLDLPAVEWKTDSNWQEGFHHRVMGIEELSENNEIATIKNPRSRKAEKYGFEGIEGFAYPWDFENRFVIDRLNNGIRVLFIRDSFGTALRPFLREAFKESVFIFDAWQFKLNEKIVEQYKPDAVVFIGLETNVTNFLKDYEK